MAPNYFASGLGGPDHLMATPLVMQNFRLHKEVSARRLQLCRNYAQGEVGSDIVKQVNRG
jgi:hypothetical protein